MSGSQNGDAAARQRSVSPTKRSAALMEGSEESTAALVDGSEEKSSNLASDPPPYSPMADVAATSGETMTIDEQVIRIMTLSKQSMSEGQKGFVVSYKWLGRVISRSTDPILLSTGREFDKDATEGDIGSVDNSDIVAPDAFQQTITPFESSTHPYIPLLPGLTIGIDFEILPEEAWNHVLSWYGLAEGQLPIVRFAHNTAPPGTGSNMLYETYPPIFTIRKVTPEANRMPISSAPPANSNTDQANAEATVSSTHSVRVVASRTERFQALLARSKTLASIPIAHKVQIWRQLDSAQADVEKEEPSQPGMLTPATSRSTSPASEAASRSSNSLLIAPNVFANRWVEGTDYEKIEARDETNNPNYNGRVSLDTLGLGQDQVLILEEQVRGPAGGEYISDARRKTNKNATTKTASAPSSPAPSGPLTRGRSKRDGRPRGTIGLSNLGNTCYMNSALQCISRVEELALYFLHSNFKQDINANNPLGYGGRMAKAYADLLTGLYSPGATSAFRPGQFKGALATAQPMFSGYGQQDSQEFLSFLVDALHEDLNRIQKKPYIENPDSDDDIVHDPEAIKALGQTYQNNHRLRNDSVAMDLFNGFYKNTMVCPDCDKVSITFDPYSLLTLQLPIENTWRGTIYFVPQLGKPIAYEVDVDKSTTWRAVKQFIASKTEGLTRDRLMFAEVFGHKFYKVFGDTDTIAESGLQSNDLLCMYELPASPTNAAYSPRKRGYRSIYSSPEPPMPAMDSPLADQMAVPIMHCRGEVRNGSPSFVLNPSFILVSREEAKDYDAILRKVLTAVASLTSRDFLHEFGQDHPLASTEVRANPDAAQQDGDTPAADADSEGRVTDNSVPSEDGYVDVALQGDVTSKHAGNSELLDPTAFLPPALRNLFEMKYVDGVPGDMFCAGNGNLGSLKSLQDRVEPRNLRRGSLESIQSTSSSRSQESTSSDRNGSPPSSDEDAPDLVIGGKSADFAGDVESEDEVPQVASKHNRRKDFNKKRGNRRNKNTYFKKGRRNSKQSVRSNVSTAQPTSPSDDFYIRLGEGIVLDWHDEAFDALFGGGTSGDDLRGNFTFEFKQIPVAEDLALRAKLDSRKRRAQNGITLEDCFAETGKTEILSEENAWYCSRCKELRRASKTLEIWTAPDILVVHLKRFSGERYRRDKVDVLVDFPIEDLDMTKRIGCKEDGKEYIYDLFAVDNHYGGLGGGHYTAYAKNFFDGKWYDFNDSSVSEQKQVSRVVSTAAYLLFYRRRSPQPLGPPALQELVNKVRNSDNSDASDAEYESSGEGVRLGGNSSVSSRLAGSPSAGTVVAGAATGTRLHEGADGLGNAANQGVMSTIASEDGDDEGYQSGPLTNQQSSWTFTNLIDDAPHMTLEESYNSLVGNDSASDRPEAGSDYAQSLDGGLESGLNDFDDDNDVSGDWTGNNDQDEMFNDVDDSTYLDAEEKHEPRQALSSSIVHVDNGETGTEEADPPVKDIKLDEE